MGIVSRQGNSLFFCCTNYTMKVNIPENEAKFQEAMKNWEGTSEGTSDGTKRKYSEIMFDCIYKACTNIALSIYRQRGFDVNLDKNNKDLIYNKAIDATLTCMRNILERGHRPQKLSSYCYLRVLAEVNKRPPATERLEQVILAATPSADLFYGTDSF